MKIIIYDIIRITNRISEFYVNAKRVKYKHNYGWDEVLKDIDLARTDTNFTPYNSSKQDWIIAGYKVVVNKRGWAFAYLIDNSGDMVIYDVENYRNLDIPIRASSDLGLYQQLSSVKSVQPKAYSPIGFGWWAVQHDDGYIYIHDRKGNIMPNIRFNEIVKVFRKRRDDANVYAVGQYGGKNFKLYLNGKHVMLENRNNIRLKEHQFFGLISECVKKILKEIA